ncbi:MAG: hypothetical protein HDR31_00575 [Mycoplasma sp.]|nr:hypothetical protein [Mycoplasma sp.]
MISIFKTKAKVNYYARLSYTKQTRAEVTKNLFKDKKMLDEVLSKEKSYFKASDFSYVSFENDDNKVFKIFLVASVKDVPKVYNRLESDLKTIFDCNDIEISKTMFEISNDSDESSDVKKKNNFESLETNSSNNDDIKKENLSSESIDSVIKDKNQISNNYSENNEKQNDFSAQKDSGNNNAEKPKDNSNYTKSQKKKEDEKESKDQIKEFKYF